MQKTFRHSIVRTIASGALTGVGTTFSPSWDLADISDVTPKEHIGFERLGIFIRISAFGGTTPTMAVALEISEDNINWETLSDALTGLNSVTVRTALLISTYPARFERAFVSDVSDYPIYFMEVTENRLYIITTSLNEDEDAS